MQSYCELELAVGDTILIGNQPLTLLDIEGEVGLFQLDADNEYHPISGEELFELFSGSESMATLPR